MRLENSVYVVFRNCANKMRALRKPFAKIIMMRKEGDIKSAYLVAGSGLDVLVLMLDH